MTYYNENFGESIKVDSLQIWGSLDNLSKSYLTDYSSIIVNGPRHRISPLPLSKEMHHRFIIWDGDITLLQVDAITNSEKYNTAAEHTLYSGYRNVPCKAKELNLKTITLWDSQNRILDMLNYPLMHRCPELGILVDRCSIRELQDVYPTLVNSIFSSNGGTGWGLRTTTRETNPHDFDVLYNFFIPLGPMFRLCYRLLNDSIKFELNIDSLPHKMIEMLQSGQYSIFYADLLNIDPFRRTVSSMSLNAFDYFILNFVVHGTMPLHKMFPAALNVHNERSKTAYFFLTADYLCAFMPSNPEAVVMPTNICGTVKVAQAMPVQPLQPTRSPKYLTLSPLTHFTTPNKSVARSGESPRAYAWRTESVLYFFVDCWLRFDVDENRDLPSSEFVRVVRILVKQLHAFGNSAELDNTSMATLRKLAQPMMNARIYPFLKSIIARWPLDSSMSVVLELWLSYIQPWRYTYNRDYSNVNMDNPINPKFEQFISENLVIYTQIFIQILPRFERLDFTSFRNSLMLHRLIKVFSQSNLPQMLRYCEEKVSQSMSTIASSPQTSPKRSMYYRSMGPSPEWDTFRNNKYFQEASYLQMFGESVQSEIQQFIRKIYISKMYVTEEIESIQTSMKQNTAGFFKYIAHLISSLFDDVSEEVLKLQELKKIPDVLELAIQSLSYIFQVSLPDISIEHIEPREVYYSDVNFSTSDGNILDISRISPGQMRNSMSRCKYTMDPALLPIQGHECTVLVRFLHQLTSKLNAMFSSEMSEFWYRNDLWGKITRQILNPPITVQHFDKSKGFSTLKEERLPPRLCLRYLASYKTLVIVPIACFIAQTLWGAPSLGLLILIFFTLLYIFIMALIS